MRAPVILAALSLCAGSARGEDARAAPSSDSIRRGVHALVAARGRIPLTSPAPGEAGEHASPCDVPADLGAALDGAAPKDGVRVCTVSDRKLAVAVTGPAGSGRFWVVAVGAPGPRGGVAGACIETTTIAWRAIPPSLLRAGDAPRWDACPADLPGRIEIWYSVPATARAEAGEHVLVSIVYQLQGLELLMDDGATRRRAAELAAFYRRAARASGDRLHADAAEALDALAAPAGTRR